MELIPPEAEEAIAAVLTKYAKSNGGAYEDRNWEKGMSWMRVYASARRHLNKWAKGIDRDSESGLTHLQHALTNLAFLVAYESRRSGEDDRPMPSPITETVVDWYPGVRSPRVKNPLHPREESLRTDRNLP